MEKYYTIQEVVEITRFAKQTIYNRLSQNRFQLGVHYIKPSPRKILFLEEGIQFLLGLTESNIQTEPQKSPAPQVNENQKPVQNNFVTKEFHESQSTPSAKSAFNI